MSQHKRILVLGSSGFVGKAILKQLSLHHTVFGSSREQGKPGDQYIFWDLEKEETWQHIIDLRPDIVINAAGYGVVKTQTDAAKMRMVNYYQPYLLKTYLDSRLTDYFWIQIGSAFEYDLNIAKITEQTPTVPLTEYGISKVLMSHALLESSAGNFLILRPFAMFGPGEDASKIIPALIIAQRDQQYIDLSSGLQQRDYFFVNDLADFIATIIQYGLTGLSREIINLGSNVPVTLKSMAMELSKVIPDFNAGYWKWGSIAQRQNEGSAFYNTSDKATRLGFVRTLIQDAYQDTVEFYYQRKV